MAEFVQLRKELSLTEYEQMKKLQLFNDEELRKIKKTRENFEYKIEKQFKELKDYCEYIKYERSILGIISERRKVRHVKEKKALERIIAMKIRGLYKKVLARFPQDIRLWDSFIKFCQGYHFDGEIPEVVDRMLQFHSEKPEIWLKAVLIEYNANQRDMMRVKYLLTSGLKYHPKDVDLHKAFLQIELDEVREPYENPERTAVDEKVIETALNHCKAFYKNSKSIIDDAEFYLDMLEVTLRFPYARELTGEIVADIKNNYFGNPKVWHCFAQLELAGKSVLSTELIRPNNLKWNIQRCVELYEEGLNKIPNQEMCDLYIDGMLKLNEIMDEESALRRKCLGKAFKLGHEMGLMSSKHYHVYLKLLLEGGSEISFDVIEPIFEKSLQLYPKSIELWSLRLMYSIKNESDQIVQATFKKAVTAIDDEKGLPLWIQMFNYHAVQPNNDQQLNSFFQNAINYKNITIASHFKPEYVEWICLVKTIQSARQTYKQLVLNSTSCLNLHRKMAQIEMTQMNVDKSSARQCFEYATQFHGATNYQIWLEYISFERDYGDAKLMGNIYERAKKCLKDANYHDTFIKEHSLMMSGIKSYANMLKQEE